jgi:hypothetical protein
MIAAPENLSDSGPARILIFQRLILIIKRLSTKHVPRKGGLSGFHGAVALCVSALHRVRLACGSL